MVTLSREAETGAEAVAREIGGLLGWPVYDHELLELIATDLGVQSKLLQSVDERGGGWLRSDFESILGVADVGESAYAHRLAKVVQAWGARGDCVIVGRGASFILPAERTFRVRLAAPREHRVATLRKREGLDKAAAEARVADTDARRAAFVRDHFHQDAAAAHHYDLVLNAARFSPRQCAELAVEGLRRWRGERHQGQERASIRPPAPSASP